MARLKQIAVDTIVLPARIVDLFLRRTSVLPGAHSHALNQHLASTRRRES